MFFKHFANLVNRFPLMTLIILVLSLHHTYSLEKKVRFNVEISEENGRPLKNVQVSLRPRLFKVESQYDTSNYLIPNIEHQLVKDLTRFSNANGQVQFENIDLLFPSVLQVRLWGFVEKTLELNESITQLKIILQKESDPYKLALQKPASFWLGAISLKSDEDTRAFRMQCAFCHQQMTESIRAIKDIETWKDIVDRMIAYGSRIPTKLASELPHLIVQEISRIEKSEKIFSQALTSAEDLSKISIAEWSLGDGFSQMHDVLVSSSGKVYIADNIQDRLYELDPEKSKLSVYKIPHREGEQNGGLIKSRLQFFPKHESTSNAHSLAESKVDGHIFITPSAQQRLVEFDPKRKTFELHDMDEGFYPHTIRIDANDRVWFTLALSNQIAMFDRKIKKFKYYHLPSRSLKEKIITKNIKWIFWLMNAGLPLYKWLYRDEQSSGVPLPYGIDITPDQKVWFARLHTDEIGYIDPANDKVTMIKTPFHGPRRLRSDDNGNLWIVSFGDSLISKYDPSLKLFSNFPLPLPKGEVDTPYSINYDTKRDWVWVNGNQSNAIFVYDVVNSKWKTIPLPKRITFTRDIDFDRDGNAYTSNSNFPSWQIEDQQPTLIKISP